MRSATCSIWLREMKLKVSGETGAIQSAARYGGPSLHADLARIVTVIVMAGLTLT